MGCSRAAAAAAAAPLETFWWWRRKKRKERVGGEIPLRSFRSPKKGGEKVRTSSSFRGGEGKGRKEPVA